MFALITIILSVVFRLLPHPANFTPMGATAVFAGRTVSMPWMFVVTIAALMAGDLALSQTAGYAFLTHISMFVYAGFLGQALLGWAFRKLRGGSFVAAGTGAVWFFIISNFGVWTEGALYPRTLDGLVACYVNALPFFRGTILGDLTWTAVLTGVYALMMMKARRPLSTPAL